MTSGARSERTVRLLAARLEVVAQTASCLAHDEITRLLESASVATTHAVALELLREEQAAAIWADARQRHPELAHELELLQTA